MGNHSVIARIWAYSNRTLAFAGEVVPSLGHDEQLIAVFGVLSAARKNAAL